MKIRWRFSRDYRELCGPCLISIKTSEQNSFANFFEARTQKGRFLDIHLGDSSIEEAPWQIGLDLCYAPALAGVFSELPVVENWQIFQRDPTNFSGNRTHFLKLFPEFRDLEYRRVALLSGGQQQILNLSRLWFSSARVAIIDEPGIGLSQEWESRYRDGLLQLIQERSLICFLVNSGTLWDRLINQEWNFGEGGLCLSGS